MIEKKIDIYSENFIQVDLNNTELICELNNSYAILVASDIAGKEILAYEYFEFDALNDAWMNVFNEIKLLSKILTNTYSNSRLFYNFPEVLVVPALYDTEDNAKIYLDTFYNSLKKNVIDSDKLSAFDNVSVIYSVDEEIKQLVQNSFNPQVVYHSYSKLLQNIFQAQYGASQQEMYLFFYNQMFVLVLADGLQLRFIKSVNYCTADDVLYFVLNVAKQYGINTEQLQLKVSGFINSDSQEFLILQKCFTYIVVEERPATKLLTGHFKGFPKQYFTPFFYLLA